MSPSSSSQRPRPIESHVVPTVEGFDRLELLGTGGCASVYAATDSGSGDRVALKVPIGAGGDVERFRRERRMLSRLSSVDAIVGLRGASVTADGRPVLAMDLMAGGSLAERVGDHVLDPPEVKDIGVRLAVACELAHGHGVIHRDIKPANVLLDEQGRAALGDFGIAMELDQPTSSTNLSSLSPPHAPPERFTGDVDVDPRAGDIWSLGSTLYTALTGEPPFGTAADGGVAGLVGRVVGAPMPPICRPDLPAGIEGVLARALAKDPAERYASMAVFAEQLERAGA